MPPQQIVVDGARYVLTRVVAKSANLSPDYITRFCRTGLVQAVRHNGLWYVNETSLRDFLAGQARQQEEWKQGQSQLRKEELRRALSAAEASIIVDAKPSTDTRPLPTLSRSHLTDNQGAAQPRALTSARHPEFAT